MTASASRSSRRLEDDPAETERRAPGSAPRYHLAEKVKMVFLVRTKILPSARAGVA